ncbi:hypothetical protein BDZ89DRAFT_1240526 [Hymenopellis radicata]|nr:hypothetical protein BDZ89DRAFT_1240526 [Hymenopellis radicata]
MISLLCFSLCLTSSLGLRVYGQCARTVGTGNSAACEHARNGCGLTAEGDGRTVQTVIWGAGYVLGLVRQPTSSSLVDLGTPPHRIHLATHSLQISRYP